MYLTCNYANINKESGDDPVADPHGNFGYCASRNNSLQHHISDCKFSTHLPTSLPPRYNVPYTEN